MWFSKGKKTKETYKILSDAGFWEKFALANPVKTFQHFKKLRMPKIKIDLSQMAPTTANVHGVPFLGQFLNTLLKKSRSISRIL